MAKSEKTIIGWREWVELPALGIDYVKAKIDTGARSSALHAFDIEYIRHHGAPFVRFSVHPIQRNSRITVTGEEELVERRWVTSSVGHRTLRPVIVTPVSWQGKKWDIELTLVNRDAMGFRMLLGRQAVRGLLIVDPARSFVAGKPPSAAKSGTGKRRKKKRRKKAAKKRTSNKRPTNR